MLKSCKDTLLKAQMYKVKRKVTGWENTSATHTTKKYCLQA